MFLRNCPKCNSEIQYNYQCSKRKAEQKKTICASCRNLDRELKPNCQCSFCNKDLYRSPSTKNRGKYVFCTYGCKNKFYGPRRIKKNKIRNRICDQKNIRYKKEKAIEYKGGRCELCGYNKCIAAFDFHHINPQEKKYNIKDLMTRKWDLVKEEIDKCILLCSNCHRELHWNERNKK